MGTVADQLSRGGVCSKHGDRINNMYVYIYIYTSDRLCYRIQEGQIQLHVLLIDCVAEDKGDRYTTSDRGITLVKW